MQETTLHILDKKVYRSGGVPLKIENSLTDENVIPILFPRAWGFHVGVPNGNHIIIPLESLKNEPTPAYEYTGLESATLPVPSPILVDHDYEHVVGRLLQNTLQFDDSASAYGERIDFYVTNQDAIQKILDRSYWQVSVGIRSDDVRCSICGAKLFARDVPPEDLGCEHQRGAMYDGQIASYVLQRAVIAEHSLVSLPADKHATIDGYVEPEIALAFIKDLDASRLDAVELYKRIEGKYQQLQVQNAALRKLLVEAAERTLEGGDNG